MNNNQDSTEEDILCPFCGHAMILWTPSYCSGSTRKKACCSNNECFLQLPDCHYEEATLKTLLKQRPVAMEVKDGW